MPHYEPMPYDRSWHAPSTAAGKGGCSWHGPMGCPDEPVVSFKDMQEKRQSGCRRAVSELAARGEIDTEAARPYLTE